MSVSNEKEMITKVLERIVNLICQDESNIEVLHNVVDGISKLMNIEEIKINSAPSPPLETSNIQLSDTDISNMRLQDIKKIQQYADKAIESTKIQFNFDALKGMQLSRAEDAAKIFDVIWYSAELVCLKGDPLDSTLRFNIENESKEYKVKEIKMYGKKTTWKYVYNLITDGIRMNSKIKDNCLILSIQGVEISIEKGVDDPPWGKILDIPPMYRPD